MDGRRIRVKKKLFRLKNIGIRMDVALARHSSFHETEIIQSSVSVITSGGSRGARPRPPPPPYFLTKLRPQGPKFFFWRPAPSPLLYLRVRKTGPLPYLKVWCGFTAHCTTYAYCYSFFHFLFITVLSSCSSRCVPACVCCFY